MDAYRNAISLFTNTVTPSDETVIKFSKYRQAPWFDLETRIRNSRWTVGDIPQRVLDMKLSEDITRTVRDLPYLASTENGLIIGWLAKPAEKKEDQEVVFYSLAEGDGQERLGSIAYRNGMNYQFLVKAGGLSATHVSMDAWEIVLGLFPQVQNLELMGDVPEEVTGVTRRIKLEEKNTTNHIAAMKRKFLNGLAAWEKAND